MNLHEWMFWTLVFVPYDLFKRDMILVLVLVLLSYVHVVW